MAAALLDTSVVVDLNAIDEGLLPAERSIATITLAESSSGFHAVVNGVERAARQQILQSVESAFAAVPFDSESGSRIRSNLCGCACGRTETSRRKSGRFLHCSNSALTRSPTI